MAAESNVGARLFLIGKDSVLAGLKEIQGATARLNAEIAAGAKSSATAAAGYAEQGAGLEALGVKMDLYRDNLAAVDAETNALARVGKVAFLGLTAAAAAWGYESIKWARSYQTALVQLNTQAGLHLNQVNAIGAAAKRNAASLGISPTAYVQAAYHPASAGFGKTTVREAVSITNNAAKLAAIGGSPVETTTNALTGIMKSYGYKPSQTTHTAALLNAIIGAGNMHAATLNAALASGVAATSKTYGVSLTSMGGTLAYLTDRGVPAAQAGTHLRMTEALLGAPSKAADTVLKAAGLTTKKIMASNNAMSQMLQEAGVTTTELSRALRTNKGKGGIFNALSLLKGDATRAGLTKEMQGALISRAFGGGRMGTTMMQLYSTVGGLGSKTTKINQNATTSKFMKDWKAETATLDFQLHKLGATIETLGTKFGLKLIPPLTKVVAIFTDMLKWLGKNKEVVLGLAGAVSAVLVPAIGVYLYRSLLSSGGAIQSVIRGYAKLISGQTAEQIALKRTNTQLAASTGETNALAAADARLGGASESAAGKIALEDDASMGGSAGLKAGMAGVAGKLMGAGALAYGGYLAGSLVRGKNGTVLKTGKSFSSSARTLGGDMLEGAGAGAAIGSVIPGVGTVIGAGVGAAAGGIYAEHSQIASTVSHGWDDLFGGGSTPSSPKPIAIHNHVTVEIDGKQVTKVVNKRTKATAARMS